MSKQHLWETKPLEIWDRAKSLRAYWQKSIDDSAGDAKKLLDYGFATPPSAEVSSIFSDVYTNSSAYTAIHWAHNESLVTGSNGKFNPGGKMTRAQFVLVLYRLAGSPAVSGSHSFGDVPASSIASDAITWASQNNIVTGQAGNFNPSSSISRAQLVLMLHRYNTLMGGDSSSDSTALSSLSDRDSISSTAREAMRWAVTHGLLTGGGGNINPNGNMTRAQVALVLYRYNCHSG